MRRWLVQVEVIGLSLRDGRLHQQCTTETLAAPASPHATALRLAGLDPADPAALCHSTSWRVQDDRRLVLTYAALPVAWTGEATPCRPSLIVAAADAVLPQPELLEPEHVVTHALRHLALLSREDPTVRALVDQAPGLWDAIRRTAAGAVTATEDDVAASAS